METHGDLEQFELKIARREDQKRFLDELSFGRDQPPPSREEGEFYRWLVEHYGREVAERITPKGRWE